MKFLSRFLLAAALVAAPAFAQQPQQTQVQDGIEVRPLFRFNFLVPEKALNDQAAQQYFALMNSAQQHGALYPANHPATVRLRGIANRIIPFAPRWNPNAANWKWEVNLLNSKQLNAFCMPGGRIAFYSGLIDQLKLSDDEIAAVMGHEIAHALREHGREQMVKSGGTSLVLRGIGAIAAYKYGLDPHTTDNLANMGSQLFSLKYSRDDEREADLVGLDLAARAGYNPRAGISLWQKMMAMNQRAPAALLSTHPGGQERIERIKANLALLDPVYAKAPKPNGTASR